MNALAGRGWGILAKGGRVRILASHPWDLHADDRRSAARRPFSSANPPASSDSSSSSSSSSTSTSPSPKKSNDDQSLQDLIAELKAQGVVFQPHGSADGEREEPWKGLLGASARASWRVGAPRPPPDLDVALRQVLERGGRTRKQLKQALRGVVQSHKALADRRERERLRLVNNREYTAHERRTDEGILPVMYGPNEALASLHFRAFPQYVVVKRVLLEARSLLGDGLWTPRRVLDFGIGCGGSSAAALHTWNDGSIEWIHGIDCSKTMRQGALLFLEALMDEQQDVSKRPKTTFAAHLASSPESSSGRSFDLALFAYTATEFTHNAATVAAAAVMFEKLRPGGLFVMVEPGTPDGFNSVRTVRNMLLDCCPPAGRNDGDEECHIIAPCTHNGRCPMERLQYNRQKHRPQPTQVELDPQVSGHSGAVEDADSDDDEEDEDAEAYADDDDGILSRGYCSFVQTMPSAPRNSSGEKFSYLVAQKRITGEVQVSRQDHRFDGLNLRDLLEHTGMSAYQVEGEWHETPEVLLKRAVDLERKLLDGRTNGEGDPLGLDFVQSDENRRTFGRIIHAPRKKRGHVLIDTCVGPDVGKIVRNKVNKSLSKAIPGIYSAARKSRWGGFWPQLDELQEDNVFRRKTDLYEKHAQKKKKNRKH